MLRGMPNAPNSDPHHVEHRRHKRFPAALQATVHIGPLHADATCTNLGQGGAFLEAKLSPKPGTPVQVAIWPTEPGNAVISLPAEVMYVVHPRHQRPAGVGVRWLIPDDPQLLALVRRVASAPPLLREHVTAEFDWNRVGSEGTGDTRKLKTQGRPRLPEDPRLKP